MSECRRCSDCIGCEHHWLEELVFETGDPEFEPVGDHVCKHCPAVGLTCDECDGGGLVEIQTWQGGDEECRACRGRGINVVQGVTVKEYEA